jgi:drug/metabolite transporter (DMT)-like permease
MRSVAFLLPAVVLSWGFSWYAITLQLGAVDPSVSVFWRFLMASSVLALGLILLRRFAPLQWRLHPHLAFMGAALFSLNFILFYYATQYVPSGVVSVIFASAALIIAGLEFALFGKRPAGRVIVGGALGVAGLALMFSDTLIGTRALNPYGLGLALAGTGLFSIGNIVSSRLPTATHLPSGIAIAMAYGAGLSASLVILTGQDFALPVTVSYIGGLVYLSLVASVLGFVAYLTLVKEGGPARAGYVTVLFPIVALTVSAISGEYTWSTYSGLGVLMTFGGTAIVFIGRKS